MIDRSRCVSEADVLDGSYVHTSAKADLECWAPEGVARNIDLLRFVVGAIDSPLPPWRPIPSRSAAQLLGIKLQTLANWRMRDLGPVFEPWQAGRGNRVYYRPDRIAAWLSGRHDAGWLLSGRWLQAKGIITSFVIDRRVVESRIEFLQNLDPFPPVHHLWRSFRSSGAAS